MVRRLKNVVIFALAVCFLVGFGREVWRASNISHVPINQSSAAKQENKTNDATQKESTEQAIARYNWWLTIFTGVLAVATLGLVVATAGLYFAGRRQLQFIQAEFVTTQRPRLIARHVLLAADASPIDTIVMLGHDADATGGLSVVNIGGSDAKIVRGVYRIYFTKNSLPARPPLDHRPHELFAAETIIKRGESKVVEIWGKVDLGPPDSTGLRDIRQFENEGWRVYVMGEISYRDDGGAYHYMGFCRRRMRTGRFRPVKSPDYEYAD